MYQLCTRTSASYIGCFVNKPHTSPPYGEKRAHETPTHPNPTPTPNPHPNPFVTCSHHHHHHHLCEYGYLFGESCVGIGQVDDERHGACPNDVVVAQQMAPPGVDIAAEIRAVRQGRASRDLANIRPKFLAVDGPSQRLQVGQLRVQRFRVESHHIGQITRLKELVDVRLLVRRVEPRDDLLTDETEAVGVAQVLEDDVGPGACGLEGSSVPGGARRGPDVGPDGTCGKGRRRRRTRSPVRGRGRGRASSCVVRRGGRRGGETKRVRREGGGEGRPSWYRCGVVASGIHRDKKIDR